MTEINAGTAVMTEGEPTEESTRTGDVQFEMTEWLSRKMHITLEAAKAALEAANKAVEDATNKAFENIDADTDAVLAKLDAEGADWQALMDEFTRIPA